MVEKEKANDIILLSEIIGFLKEALLGLKIQWALCPCEFDSRLRHQEKRRVCQVKNCQTLFCLALED